MKVSVLASGSKGNCTYIQTETSNILIDVGINNLNIEKKLNKIGIQPSKIDSIFITHEHIDHIAGLRVFVKKHNPTVYLKPKLYNLLKNDLNNYVLIEEEVYLNDLKVRIFKTSHDSLDSVGYVFYNKEKSIVYVTDTGYLNKKNYKLLANHNLYIFESNHDVKLLMDNPNYPYHTKQRILSDTGHLSNKDSAYYLSKLVGPKTSKIVLAHLSEQNNDPIIALENMKKCINNIDIMIASQNNEMELLEV